MNTEREFSAAQAWQRVKPILQAALELSPNQRADYLSEACAGDAALRDEVVSLIAAHEQSGSFMNSRAFALAVESTSQPSNPSGQSTTFIGRTVGHYQILEFIGRGGMGEIYRVRDIHLKREVAIKLLPVGVAADQDRVRRFKQEARASSALNHPNIITIYEIGEDQGLHFIVTELINGQTLRSCLAAAKLTNETALDIAAQIAAALAAAHQAGIIHRDIKPENVMIRRDGIVKVLDFGLAKLTPRPIFTTVESDEHAASLAKLTTEPGAVMGTPTYMSPEQARGLKVDARTDLFSLGVLLYEMIAGRGPFAGANAIDVMGAILNSHPAPLGQFAPDVPRELERIVSKALCKDRAERYQTAQDFLFDLKSLREELELDAKLVRAGQRRAHASSIISDVPPARTTARPAWRWSLAVVLLAFPVAAAVWYWFSLPFVPKPPSFQAGMRLTTLGNISRTVISPDGKYFVYAVDESGKQSLWVRQVSASNPLPIVQPDDVSYVGLTFAPDGDSVYYVAHQARRGLGTLYQIPTLGGTARKLIEDVDTPVTLSPDGKRLAFGRSDPNRGELALLVANVDGTDERKLAARKNAEFFCLMGIAWSPDGKVIACSATDKVANEDVVNVMAVRESDGVMKTISSSPWRGMRGLSWLSDGSGLIVVAAEKSALSFKLFHLSYSSGEIHKLTSDFDDYSDVSVTADAKTLITSKTVRIWNIWTVLASGDAQSAKQITPGTGTYYDVAWAPDGKIIASGEINDELNVWTMDAEGKNLRQITFGPHLNIRGKVSADGRYVVYMSNQKGAFNIWRMNADGTNIRPLTNGNGEYALQITPDGKWVFYYSANSGKDILWKVSIDGGTPVPFTDKLSRFPAISPDGKFVACSYFDEQISRTWQAAIIPITGGAPVKMLNIPEPIIRWTPDGKALSYLRTDRGVSNIWIRSLDGGPPKQLTNFSAAQIFFFDWSRDGKQIVCLRGSEVRDAFLLRD